MVRINTPRRMYYSLQEFAKALGCHHLSLYAYLEPHNGAYRLRALNEQAYQEWHETVYAQHQEHEHAR